MGLYILERGNSTGLYTLPQSILGFVNSQFNSCLCIPFIHPSLASAFSSFFGSLSFLAFRLRIMLFLLSSFFLPSHLPYLCLLLTMLPTYHLPDFSSIGHNRQTKHPNIQCQAIISFSFGTLIHRAQARARRFRVLSHQTNFVAVAWYTSRMPSVPCSFLPAYIYLDLNFDLDLDLDLETDFDLDLSTLYLYFAPRIHQFSFLPTTGYLIKRLKKVY